MTIDLKDRVPAKVRGSARRDNVPERLTLEQNRLKARTLTVRKRADGCGTLIIEAR